MRKFELVLLIHAHQPVGNFENVLERAYRTSYLPFLDVLGRHPQVRMGLHYTGPLLMWMEAAHPEYFDRLRSLVGRGQVELVGGGFYEPILAAIPPEDRREQITRLADYIERHFQVRPHGAWIAERVWEPELPSSLAGAGVEYSLVDDNHFLGAGIELEQLYGHYMCDDRGLAIKVLPGLKSLRYLVPFHPVSETIEFLRGEASHHPGLYATMGDDLEKFGVWPGTYKHCYEESWLEHFFSAIEQSADWLVTSTPGDAVASHAPLGRADLPTASYTEMMEWALPTPARDRYHELVQEFSSRPDALPFLRGGIWRGFFTKYRESNLLQKKMLHASRKVHALDRLRRKSKEFLTAREEAMSSLLQGQCNDAYWHGVFGGLYSPHLRTSVWNSLARAEAIAEGLVHPRPHYTEAARLDFDADGREEIYLTSDRYAALVVPGDGGTVSLLDFRTPNVTLINSLMRRQESYHAKLRNLPAQGAHAVQSIHDQTRTKEDGLDRWLQYDRWPRSSFRLLLFDRSKSQQDYAELRLDEDSILAGGFYSPEAVSPDRVVLASAESADWSAEKTLSFAPTQDGFEAACEWTLRRRTQDAVSVNVGIELIVNFLAPSVPDRYFQCNGQRFPLRWSAAVPSEDELRVVDEWQRAAVAITASRAHQFWIAPVETVSESEEGFERIYQGSQIMAVWHVDLPAGGEWKGRIAQRALRLD